MNKRVKDYNIILYDYFAKVFGERIASIIIIPSAIIILGIIGYGIMIIFGVLDLGDIKWIIGIGVILFIIIFSPNK